MAVPSSVKFTKNGVEYLNNIDKASYYIGELTRAALKDVGKFVCRTTRSKIRRRTGRLAKNIQYWVRKRESDLQVGFKPGGFYGGFQELGTRNVAKLAALTSSVEENIETIRKIEAQYLSAISDGEQACKGMIDEDEETGDGE